MKKHLLKIASLIFVLALVLATFAACSASGGAGGVVDALNVECKEGAKVKNFIYVIGDGMGLEHVAAGAMTSGEACTFGDWKRASVNTDSLTSVKFRATKTTDSAAAGTALATGVLTKNGRIGKDKDGRDTVTILDVAKSKGKATGIVTSDKLSGATPASFSAHAMSRKDTDDIIASQIKSGVDLLCGASSDSYAKKQGSIEQEGYAFCSDFGSRQAVLDAQKAYCLFDMGGNSGTVSLKDASKFAIDFLAKDEDGFVLMIEQAHVDKYSHKNDFGNMVKAMKALNDTIAMILDWIGDRNDTAIIVTADHETGGLSVSKQNNLPNKYDSASGTVYYAWEKKSHSDSDVGAFFFGIDFKVADYSYFNSEFLLKNCDIPKIIKAHI